MVSGEIKVLYGEGNGLRLRSPNDLVFDRNGGFYFSDLGKTRARDRDRGGIFCALPDSSRIKELVWPLHTPNGIGLSPDEQWLYVAETETARLWKYPVLGSTYCRIPFRPMAEPLCSAQGAFSVSIP